MLHLIPGVAEWNNISITSHPRIPWDERTNRLFWRDTVTKAREPERYWTRLQRGRLVSMLNATHVEIAESSIHSGNEGTVGVGYAGNSRLLPADEYKLESLTNEELAEWVNGWGNAGFRDLACGSEDNAEREGAYGSTSPSPNNLL
jgi:hypothetical protein